MMRECLGRHRPLQLSGSVVRLQAPRIGPCHTPRVLEDLHQPRPTVECMCGQAGVITPKGYTMPPRHQMPRAYLGYPPRTSMMFTEADALMVVVSVNAAPLKAKMRCHQTGVADPKWTGRVSTRIVQLPRLSILGGHMIISSIRSLTPPSASAAKAYIARTSRSNRLLPEP